jgi:hypothetical protein
MCALLACLVLAVPYPASDEPVPERIREHFQSDNYTVEWGTAAAFDPTAELVIGDGIGHGSGTLGWIRFRPGNDGVDVLSIQLDERLRRYRSKWPPDRARVVVKHARLKTNAYAALLRDLALVDSARLKPVERAKTSISSFDFWVSARLATNEKTFLDLEWAGFWTSGDELHFAKPQAAVRLAQQTVENLELKEHKLTPEERAWASAKFARDWTRYKKLDFDWWVRERYIVLIGLVGDRSALPVLRDILVADRPKKRDLLSSPSDDRCIYLAINAVTRLTGIDVRDRPVEEMDIENTRKKILELIDDKK